MFFLVLAPSVTTTCRPRRTQAVPLDAHKTNIALYSVGHSAFSAGSVESNREVDGTRTNCGNVERFPSFEKGASASGDMVCV